MLLALFLLAIKTGSKPYSTSMYVINREFCFDVGVVEYSVV